ncbi:MAG: response regulator [Cyanobacteria bacterium P01_A01_bin.84]
MTTKTILVVDNEEYIQEVIKICLETTTKWQVVTASSGNEGIKKAEIEKPDVILLDVMMPEIDGLTTFKYLQENPETKEIPVILLTAKVQTSDHQRYADLGMKATIPTTKPLGVIAKPFNPLELAIDIAKILDWKE